MKPIHKHLLTLYTRSPLHVGSDTSVDVVDLPIRRERITHFPVIPDTSLKGVLRQEARDFAASESGKAKGFTLAVTDALFGAKDDPQKDEKGNDVLHAGCVQIMEAKLLAFPVRSLSGCFAWLTCPAALRRFHLDTATLVQNVNGTVKPIEIASPEADKALVTSKSIVIVPGKKEVVFEEYALDVMCKASDSKKELDTECADAVASVLGPLCANSLLKESIAQRLAILSDEQFQHFVATCTEIVARIVIDPVKRTNTNLFNQENVPCETLFYTVLRLFPARKPGATANLDSHLVTLLGQATLLQIGGDETTGHGLCGVHCKALNGEKEVQ